MVLFKNKISRTDPTLYFKRRIQMYFIILLDIAFNPLNYRDSTATGGLFLLPPWEYGMYKSRMVVDANDFTP